MLEPEASLPTSEQEEEVMTLIATERHKDLNEIEINMTHLSMAQQMLLKITHEQAEKVDNIHDHLESAVDMTRAGNEALFESEKMAANRRKRNIWLSLFAGAVVCVAGAVTTLSVLKAQDKL